MPITIMKREYISPIFDIIRISSDVLTTSNVTNVTGNGNINWGGAGNGIGRAPGHRGIWD